MTLPWIAITGLGFGIANALHCAGMCGVFAAAAGRAPRRFFAYWTGKASTYVFLGALAGSIAERFVAPMRQATAVLSLLAGAMMVVYGMVLLVGRRAVPGGGITAWFSSIVGGIVGDSGARSPFAMGAITGFLPCGVLYLAVLQAAAAGGTIRAMVHMGAFAIGTAPVLMALAFAGRHVTRALDRRLWRWSAAVICMITGLFLLWRVIEPILVHEEIGGAACCR